MKTFSDVARQGNCKNSELWEQGKKCLLTLDQERSHEQIISY